LDAIGVAKRSLIILIKCLETGKFQCGQISQRDPDL